MSKVLRFIAVLLFATLLSPEIGQAQNNPNQTAILRWYKANQTGGGFDVVSAGALAFDGATLWVAGAPGNVTRARTSDLAVLGNYTVDTSMPRQLVFDGAYLWALGPLSGEWATLTKVRASDGATVGQFSLRNAQGVAFDGANLWVTNGVDSVSKVDPANGTVVATYPAGSNPLTVIFDGASLWVANYMPNTVTKLDPGTGAILGTSAVGMYPCAMAFDGSSVWVANQSGQSVTKVRASDGAVLGTYWVGNTPSSVVFDGAYVWVANGGPAADGGQSVVKLQPSDGSIVGRYSMASPTRLAFDGANVWVTSVNRVVKM